MYCCAPKIEQRKDAVEIQIRETLTQTEAWVERRRERQKLNDKLRQENTTRREQLEKHRSDLQTERLRLEAELQQTKAQLQILEAHFQQLETAEAEVRQMDADLREEDTNLRDAEASIKNHLSSISYLATTTPQIKSAPQTETIILEKFTTKTTKIRESGAGGNNSNAYPVPLRPKSAAKANMPLPLDSAGCCKNNTGSARRLESQTEFLSPKNGDEKVASNGLIVEGAHT